MIAAPPIDPARRAAIEAFYGLLDELEGRIGGRRRLGDCNGRMPWPDRGVCFFFEPGEDRAGEPGRSRVVHVGTHALTPRSRSTLWGRLHQHRGTKNPPGGNHRGSIFRILIGEALINRDGGPLLDHWGQGKTAAPDVLARERDHEIKVSDYLGNMTLLFVNVPDRLDGPAARGFLKDNSVALLSGHHAASPDRPSAGWLGHHSGRERVRNSGLWNNNHVDDAYDPDLLNLFEDLVKCNPFT